MFQLKCKEDEWSRVKWNYNKACYTCDIIGRYVILSCFLAPTKHYDQSHIHNWGLNINAYVEIHFLPLEGSRRHCHNTRLHASLAQLSKPNRLYRFPDDTLFSNSSISRSPGCISSSAFCSCFIIELGGSEHSNPLELSPALFSSWSNAYMIAFHPSAGFFTPSFYLEKHYREM